jgi:hypothetical protein
LGKSDIVRSPHHKKHPVHMELQTINNSSDMDDSTPTFETSLAGETWRSLEIWHFVEISSVLKRRDLSLGCPATSNSKYCGQSKK